MHKYRKFITSSVGLTFMVVGFTGVMFQFFFKNHVLTQIHAWLGVGMVVAALGHIAQNWAPLRRYFKDLRVVALLIPLVLVAGFLVLRPEDPKRFNQRDLLRQLTHAKTDDLAKVFGKAPETVIAAMKADGVKIGNAGESLQEVADQNDRSPESLFNYFVN